MLRIKEINDKKKWEIFLGSEGIGFYPLFQSWNWGEVQKKLGFEIIRLGIFDNKKGLISVCQVVFIRAKRGTYLHLRHGPVFKNINSEAMTLFLEYIKKLALEKRASFVRISPLLEKNNSVVDFLKKKGFINAPMHNMDAEICWVLDITKSEDQLLREMRKTHRYLIKKSDSMGIKIIRTKNVNDMALFMPLYNDLSHRKHFVPHKGVKEEFEIFSKEDAAILLLAEFDNKIIAGAMVIFTPSQAIYRHGASLDEYKNIPVSYALQWGAIKEAKKRGLPLYNFWGIAPSSSKNHPWQGLTLFKTGFGGEKKEFTHAQDLVLTPFYWKTYIIEFFSKVVKGY